jgi:hypothetical protein
LLAELPQTPLRLLEVPLFMAAHSSAAAAPTDVDMKGKAADKRINIRINHSTRLHADMVASRTDFI